jgi:hypothetical protein
MSGQQGFDDVQAQQILKRAAEIEAERGRILDASALREIAAEAGISPVALEQALRERHVAKTGRRSRPAAFTPLLIFAGILVVFAAVFVFIRMMVPPG